MCGSAWPWGPRYRLASTSSASPVGVTDRVPQVEGYRYIVVEDDVVIVDPQDRLVALVITG